MEGNTTPETPQRVQRGMKTGFQLPPNVDGDERRIRPYVEPLRQVRGFTMARSEVRTVRKEQLADGSEVYHVPSETQPGVVYSVVHSLDDRLSCANCPDFKNHSNDACKHIVEVLYRFFDGDIIQPPGDALLAITIGKNEWYSGAQRQQRAPMRFSVGPSEAVRRDQANRYEDDAVQRHAFQIASAINDRYPQPFNPKGGRPMLPFGDFVAHEVIREQELKSQRKFTRIAEGLVGEGKLRFAPSRNTIAKYRCDDAMMTYYREGFWLTTSPFIHLERDFIIDSTGFSSFQVSCWRDANYGESLAQRNGTRWFKVHIVIGRITKAILGFFITESAGEGSSDTAQFGPLLEALHARGFQMRYIVADNIYLNRGNIAEARRHNARLIGPLKARNYKKGKPSETILPIHEFRIANPALYEELCKARQPVEGVFSIEKRRRNRVMSIGTAVERQNTRNGNGNFVYVSRHAEFMARIIRYNLSVINREEHLRDVTIRLTFAGTSIFEPIEDFLA